MDFQLKKEHQMLRKAVRDYAKKELAPSASERDAEERFDREIQFDKLAELELPGIIFPEAYGGAQADYQSYVIAIEELSRVCASSGVVLSAHVSLGSNPIYLFGTEEQKQKFLTPMAEGTKLGCLGLTEPEAGSDAGGTHASAVLDGGRIGIAAQALGIAQGAYEQALSYAQKRQQFGQPIGKFQAVQFKLADMATQIDAARFMVYRAAWCVDNKKPYTKEAAMAKCFASDVAMWVTTEAVQVLGGYGYVKDYPLERMMRDAKITQIYEGTNEIQRVVIGANIMK